MHEELLAKLRILESRRSEDRERLRELERLREEGEEWKSVRERTKVKVGELAGEVKSLKAQVCVPSSAESSRLGRADRECGAEFRVERIP